MNETPSASDNSTGNGQTELPLCPFCGKSPKVIEWPTSPHHISHDRMQCQTSGCAMFNIYTSYDQWIRRAPSDSSRVNSPVEGVVSQNTVEAGADDVEAARQEDLKTRILRLIAYDDTVSLVQSAPGKNPRALARIYFENPTQLEKLLSEHGVSSPVGGVSSTNVSGGATEGVGLRPVDIDRDRGLDTQDQAPPSPPYPVEHVRQMERDTRRLDWLSCHAQWDDGKRRVQIRFAISTVEHVTLRDTIDAAILSEEDGNSTGMIMGANCWPIRDEVIYNINKALASPVSSVERDAQQDLGEKET